MKNSVAAHASAPRVSSPLAPLMGLMGMWRCFEPRWTMKNSTGAIMNCKGQDVHQNLLQAHNLIFFTKTAAGNHTNTVLMKHGVKSGSLVSQVWLRIHRSVSQISSNTIFARYNYPRLMRVRESKKLSFLLRRWDPPSLRLVAASCEAKMHKRSGSFRACGAYRSQQQ